MIAPKEISRKYEVEFFKELVKDLVEYHEYDTPLNKMNL